MLKVNSLKKELKQIIYYHTPVEQRLNKSSLDELIEYQSSLINDDITRLKVQLSKLNTEIVFAENKSTSDFRTAIEIRFN
jgi:hypothetical protein